MNQMKIPKNNIALLSIIIITLLGCASQSPNLIEERAISSINPIKNYDYIIQAGDELDIKFYYNPEINEEVTVRPDGKISLQLIDDVQAAGLKPFELDDSLTTKYSRELKNPEVTVIVRSFTGQQVYVGGEINNQGLIALSIGMTPLQAVFNAGGFTENAKPENTIVIRKGEDNRPIPIIINLKDAIYGKSSSFHFSLQPNDVIYVPKTTIAKANQFVEKYIENLLLYRGISLGFSYSINNDDD